MYIKKNIKYYIYCSILIFIVDSCSNKKIDKSPIIKISNFEISNYEFYRELNRLNIDHQGNKEEYKKNWKKEYLENSFIICDAYNEKLDEYIQINEQIEVMSDFMMAQKYGYLWKETVSPIVDKFMEVTNDKAEKRKKLFYFDYMKIKNHDSTNLHYTINSVQDYNKLKSQCAKDSNIQTSYVSMQWPFSLFYKNSHELYSMQPGHISSPIKSFKDVFYFYLDHIENIEIDDNDKKQLSSLLQKIKEDEIEEKKTVEMLANGQPQLFNEGINNITSVLKRGESIYNYSKNPLLLEYKINGKIISLDFNTFIGRIKKLPFKSEINDSTEFVSEIYQYFYGDYLKNEALNLGLYSKDEFVLDKRNYKNKLLLNHYNNVHFIDSVKIDSTELREYYLNNISTYTIPEGFRLDIFYFNRAENAEQFLKELAFKTESQKEYMDKAVTKGTRGFVDYKKEYVIDKNGNELPGYVITELELLPDFTLHEKVIDNNGQYLVVFKRKPVHNHVKKFDTVSKEIYHRLFKEKFNELRKTRVEELKKKYPLEINKTGVEI
ncbi:MAG: peptidyl-prolyl cis-trans isomerase [Prolixibacteraceae bacterium]|nr:peptidyl-prolyl cis-trans isomerase [Prolixibacteraceae bacterium]